MGKLDEFKLNNTIEYKGYWDISSTNVGENEWIQTAVPGVLKLNNGQAKLELNGVLNFLNHIKIHDGIDIFGYLSNGLYVKLEKCYQISMKLSVPGYKIENYICNKCIVLNKNYFDSDNDEDIKVTKVRFSIDYLEDWYNVDLPESNIFDEHNDFSIKYKNEFFENNEFKILNDDYIIKLVRKQNFNYLIHRGVVPEVKSYIKVSSINFNAVSLYTMYEIATWMKDFINFITQIYGNFLCFEFALEDKNHCEKAVKLDNGDYKCLNPIYLGKLLIQQIIDGNNQLKVNSLRLKDILEDFDLLIRNWFLNKEKLIYIISLHNQNKISNLDINTKLVNQIKILETYYDNYKKREREEISDRENKLNETKSKVKEFLNEIDVENNIKEEIVIKIDHKSKSKNPSLREKLKVTLEDLPEDLKCIFYYVDPGWEKDNNFTDEFAERLKDTRNYHIHGANPNKNKKRYKTIKEIITVNQILDYIIYFLVLKSLELDDMKILNYPFIKQKLKNY